MRRVLRIGGFVAAGVLVLVLGGMAAVWGVSERRFQRTFDVPPASIAATLLPEGPPPAELVERGAHVARIRGCLDCHAGDGGGQLFIESPALGMLWATNLTRGESGIAGTYTDAQWDMAVRHGLRPEGKPLHFMPSHEFWPLGDDDLAALVAYFRAAPPVDRPNRPSRPGPLARVLFLTGALPLIPAELVDHAARRPDVPTRGATAEYGAYLATGCTGCHGPGFSGGRIPGADPAWPAATNITPDRETGIATWSEADFARALREGVRPDGTRVDPVMPLSMTRHLTDDEVSALYAYLSSLPPRPYGNR